MAAATYDLTSGTKLPYVGAKVSVVEALLDCSVNEIGSSESASLIYIPADTFVIAVIHDVLTAEGGAATADLGDSSSATQFTSNVNMNAATNASSATTAAKYYAAADDIRITADAALDAAVILVKAIMVNVGDAKASYS